MTPSEPKWVSIDQALYIHEQALKRHDGGKGLRDRSLLESTMARAENQYNYIQPDLFELAATYAVAIAANHPFVDGNKCTTYAVAGLFLYFNGYRLMVANEQDQIALFENVAEGKTSIGQLADFYRGNTVEL